MSSGEYLQLAYFAGFYSGGDEKRTSIEVTEEAQVMDWEPTPIRKDNAR